MRKIEGMIFAVVFIIIGVVCLISSAGEAKRCTAQIDGTVDGYITEESNEEGDLLYYPEIRFKYDGQQYIEKSPSGSGKMKYPEGSVITILVNPEDPTDFIINGDKTARTIGFVMIILGVIFLAVILLGLGEKMALASGAKSGGIIGLIRRLISSR